MSLTTAIGYLIEIATNKKEYLDYNSKHGNRAKYGWVYYDVYFGIPVFNNNRELLRYNYFKTKMIVRKDKTKKSYLYDFVRIKKEDI